MSQMPVGQPMLSAILLWFDYDLRCVVCCDFILFALVIYVMIGTPFKMEQGLNTSQGLYSTGTQA